MNDPQLNAWKSNGEIINYGPFSHRVFVKQIGNRKATADKTLLLIHGFPESSYSYHAIIDGMLKAFDQIILCDLIGYGNSDKPETTFTYSIIEQADLVLAVWRHFGITGGHLLSHDMGVSVATEILYRHESDLLPAWFNSGLQSLTVTNGSLVLELAELRITQKILLSRYGHLMKNFISFNLFKHQVKSAHGNAKLSLHEIEAMWNGNILQDGHKKTYLTIKYLNDRKRFEKTRWLPALGSTLLPVHICWGDQDAVARVEMAYYVKENVSKNATLTIMEGLGHFGQLGSPAEWVEYICRFYANLRSK